jgi:hypothetical protein
VKRPGRPRLLPLLDWIPAVSPRFFRPEHLADVAGVFHRLDRGESVEVCFSFPPRHMKTTTLEHGVARWMRVSPVGDRAFQPIVITRFTSS